MSEEQQRQIDYLAAMLAAVDGMVWRMALSLSHHAITGVDELLIEYNNIKGNVNRDYQDVFDSLKERQG